MVEVFINPRAGGKIARAREAVERFCKAQGMEYRVTEGSSAKDLTARCRAAAEAGAERIVVLGGDGTIRDAAQGVYGTKTMIGIVPCGTGNDFIRAVGVPEKLESAVKVALTGRPLAVDVIDLEGFIVVNYLGAGIDSNSVYYAKRSRLRGMAAYLFGLFKALAGLKPICYRCVLDGKEERTGKGIMINIANGGYFGGGIHAFPPASVTDGKLDVMLVRDLKRRQILPVLPKLIKGNHVGHPYVEFLRCEEASFVFTEEAPMGADGEIFTRKEFTAKIRKQALYVSV